MESATQNKTIKQQTDEATRWKAREWVALGFLIFLGLVMISAVTDIVLGGVITSFLAGSIPLIASVASLLAFPWLVLLGSTIAIGICLLSIAWHRNNALIDLLSKIQTEENKSKNNKDINENDVIIDIRNIIDEKNISKREKQFKNLVVGRQVNTLGINADSKEKDEQIDALQAENNDFKKKLNELQVKFNELQKNNKDIDKGGIVIHKKDITNEPIFE